MLFVSCFISEQLLSDFFEFYATFPFSRMSINIRKVSNMKSMHINQKCIKVYCLKMPKT